MTAVVTSGLPSRSRWSRSRSSRRPRRRWAPSPRPRAMSSWTARISRRRSATRLGRAALELVDRARRLARVCGGTKVTPRCERELAQVALLAGCRRWPGRVAGLWVVIGHGRAWARRAGPSSPGPSGLAKRPAGQGLTALRARRAWLADRTERHPHQRRRRTSGRGRCKGAVTRSGSWPGRDYGRSGHELAGARGGRSLPTQTGHGGVLAPSRSSSASVSSTRTVSQPIWSSSSLPRPVDSRVIRSAHPKQRSRVIERLSLEQLASNERMAQRAEAPEPKPQVRARGNPAGPGSTPRCREAHRGDPAAASSQGMSPATRLRHRPALRCYRGRAAARYSPIVIPGGMSVST